MTKSLTITLTAILSIYTGAALAGDPESCKKVRFSDVGWTDITATTAMTSLVLEAIGYNPESRILSIPVTYTGLKSNDIDVYLGDWQPSLEVDRKPYLDEGALEVVGPNLTGAKYTLAVPAYVAAEGVKDFSDLNKYSDKFNSKIFGIEPGNNGNRIILEMVESNQFDLGKWQLIESSESAMLAEVNRAINKKQWIAFLAWAPHPMNNVYQIEYLSGGDETFGPDYGGATIYTNVRKNYLQECPNVGKLITNLRFDINAEGEWIGAILNDGKLPKAAVTEWLKANPEAADPWLEGVTTYDGGDARAALRSKLGL